VADFVIFAFGKILATSLLQSYRSYNAFICRWIKFQIMRCKFAGLAVRPRIARSPCEFIVRINLTFNFPRRAFRRFYNSPWCARSETLRFRIIRRAISSSTICLSCNFVLSYYQYNWSELLWYYLNPHRGLISAFIYWDFSLNVFRYRTITLIVFLNARIYESYLILWKL